MTDTPKLWRDMTDAEKCELLLAFHQGETIQYFRNTTRDWDTAKHPAWSDHNAYRKVPEFKRETVAVAIWLSPYGKVFSLSEAGEANISITFDLIDGEPDCKKCPTCGTAPIDMEKL